jgi:glycosyltransferase involved in cell wall biosynthesis
LDQADDLLIYHYSIYDPNYRFYQMARGRKILVYHNITPPHFFRSWDQTLEALCSTGRWILTELQDCDLALGDSDFNRLELVDAGFAEEKTGVLPIFLAQGHFDSIPADRGLMARLRGTTIVNFLTVGRVVPNKAIDDVIRIFSVYHRAINPRSRLYIVGSRYLPAYDAAPGPR